MVTGCGWWGSFGTLLGPEATGTALRAPFLWGCVGVVGCWLGFLRVAPFLPGVAVHVLLLRLMGVVVGCVGSGVGGV
jgi:hypothetical protein